MLVINLRRALFGLVLGMVVSTASAADVASQVNGAACNACDIFCNDACGGGFYFGGEAVTLKAYANYGYEGEGNHTGYRLVGGYQTCDGLGVRVRYFDYDGLDDSNYGAEATYFDTELTTTLDICNTQVMLSGGFRCAEVSAAGEYMVFDDAKGVTFGIQMNRQICGNLGAFGWVQESLLYGDDDYTGYSNGLLGWTEAQIGLQYNCCLAGMNAWVRGGAEAHHFSADHDYSYGDSGLFGWFIGGGVNF